MRTVVYIAVHLARRARRWQKRDLPSPLYRIYRDTSWNTPMFDFSFWAMPKFSQELTAMCHGARKRKEERERKREKEGNLQTRPTMQDLSRAVERRADAQNRLFVDF